MKKRTVKTNDLTPGDTFLIKGNLSRSRLATQIEGEELAQENKRRRSYGMPPVNRAFTSASVYNAQVLYSTPGEKTPAEIYAEESLFKSKLNKFSGDNFAALNKGKALPFIATKKPHEAPAKAVVLEGELARGLDVILIMRVYGTSHNNGITLDGVIINEPIRYWTDIPALRGLDTPTLTRINKLQEKSYA